MGIPFLSLVGKSLIVNASGISKLLYLASILSFPKWVATEVINLVWPFLWGCRIETTSAVVLSVFSDGGWGVGWV